MHALTHLAVSEHSFLFLVRPTECKYKRYSIQSFFIYAFAVILQAIDLPKISAFHLMASNMKFYVGLALIAAMILVVTSDDKKDLLQRVLKCESL